MPKPDLHEILSETHNNYHTELGDNGAYKEHHKKISKKIANKTITKYDALVASENAAKNPLISDHDLLESINLILALDPKPASKAFKWFSNAKNDYLKKYVAYLATGGFIEIIKNSEQMANMAGSVLSILTHSRDTKKLLSYDDYINWQQQLKTLKNAAEEFEKFLLTIIDIQNFPEKDDQLHTKLNQLNDLIKSVKDKINKIIEISESSPYVADKKLIDNISESINDDITSIKKSQQQLEKNKFNFNLDVIKNSKVNLVAKISTVGFLEEKISTYQKLQTTFWRGYPYIKQKEELNNVNKEIHLWEEEIKIFRESASKSIIESDKFSSNAASFDEMRKKLLSQLNKLFNTTFYREIYAEKIASGLQHFYIQTGEETFTSTIKLLTDTIDGLEKAVIPLAEKIKDLEKIESSNVHSFLNALTDIYQDSHFENLLDALKDTHVLMEKMQYDASLNNLENIKNERDNSTLTEQITKPFFEFVPRLMATTEELVASAKQLPNTNAEDLEKVTKDIKQKTAKTYDKEYLLKVRKSDIQDLVAKDVKNPYLAMHISHLITQKYFIYERMFFDTYPKLRFTNTVTDRGSLDEAQKILLSEYHDFRISIQTKLKELDTTKNTQLEQHKKYYELNQEPISDINLQKLQTLDRQIDGLMQAIERAKSEIKIDTHSKKQTHISMQDKKHFDSLEAYQTTLKKLTKNFEVLVNVYKSPEDFKSKLAHVKNFIDTTQNYLTSLKTPISKFFDLKPSYSSELDEVTVQTHRRSPSPGKSST